MSDMKEYKCPACGGAVEFDSSIQKMKCPYCDTEFELDVFENEEELVEDNLNWNTDNKETWSSDEAEDMDVYVCKSCGGQIIADANTGASKCPYCDNPIVMEGQFVGNLKPDCIIPFKLDKKAAKDALKKHLQGKALLPKIFKDENHLDEIKGVYVPFWLFDAQANADAVFKGTKIRYWSDSNYDYRETSFFNLYRSATMEVSNIPVDGSSKMPDDLMESIEPFHVNEAQPFKKAYLAGYMADKYDVSLEASIGRANERIKNSIETEIRTSALGYSSVVQEHLGVQLQNGDAKYALYPVWLLNTTWQGKKYTFAMNGQTGKFVGDLPVDKGAFWKMFGISSIGFTVLFYIIVNIIFMFLY